MQSRKQDAVALIESVRSTCIPQGGGEGVALDKVTRQLAAALEQMEPGASDDAAFHRCRAEIALCLPEPGVAQRDPSGIRDAAALLLRLGQFGRTQALRLLADAPYPPQQLVPVLEALPGRERLHLLNALCLYGEEFAPGLHPYGLSGAARCDEMPRASVIDFLADLAAEGERLAWPLKRALRRGDPASWVAGLLAGDASLAADGRVFEGLRLVGVSDGLGALLQPGRTVGWGPELLRLVAATPSFRDDPAVRKALVGLLATGGETLAPVALRVLEELGWDKLGEATARLCAGQPALRRVLLYQVLLLGERSLSSFLAQFSGQERGKVVLSLFLSLARLSPEFCRACLGRRELGMTQGMSQTDMAQTDAFLLGQERRGPFPALPRTQGRPAQSASAPEQGGGFLSRLFGRDKADLHSAVTQNRIISQLQIDDGSLFEATLSERGFRRCRLRGCRLDTVHFENSAFVETDLSATVMRKTVFSKCTFIGVSFRNAWLHECTFTSCEFKGCDFTGAALHGATLRDTALRGCHLGGTILFGAKLLGVRFTASQLADARLQRAQFRSCAFDGCSLAALKAIECAFVGTEFTVCDFASAQLEACTIFASSAKGCCLAKVRAVRCKSDEPGFIAAARQTLCEAIPLLVETSDQGSPPPGLLTESGARFMESLLAFWSRHRDMARTEWAMLDANVRRLERAEEAMGSERAEFLRLLPLLLHCDAFEKTLGFKEMVPCIVDGFTPTLSQLALLRKFFPGASVKARSASGCLRIIGLYSIGSIGTLAQADRSDLDCWVCVDGDDAARAWLRLKLDRLEAWAQERFNLEAHFFLMTIEDVRENRFGLSDEESSGSAQALLLKDEFYRTCLRLGGRLPVWWLMPPGIGGIEYRARLPQALRFPLLEPNRSVDLGPLDEIPREEFFGACLWQIVKAIKSPFKSIMKFGLLEFYSRSEEQGGQTLLCERLKDNLLGDRTSARDSDPYLLLFECIRVYYKEQGNHEALYLLREAFLQRFAADRAKIAALAAVREGFAQVLEQMPRPDETDGAGRQDPSAWSFSKSSRMGALISKFLTDSYSRIRASLDAGSGGRSSRITPEDMTKLGRRIMAMFARRANKVERIPFFKLSKRPFRELSFCAEKNPGRKPKWIIKGKPHGGGDVWETLRVSEDPAALFVWLVVNGLYSDKLPIQGDATIAPFAHEDVVGVLHALKDFFPKSVLSVSPEQYLEEEAVVRAFFICNLTAPRDVKELREVWTVYLTNWGELFCVADKAPDAMLRKSASGYLTRRLELKMASMCEMEGWQPRRSLCPRIVLV